MRFIPKAVAGTTAELGFKRRLQRACCGQHGAWGLPSKPLGRKGSIFQTPRGEAGLRGDAVRRDGLMGGGVPQPLRPPLLPHHPVARPIGKSEGSQDRHSRQTVEGRETVGAEAHETPTDVKGAAATKSSCSLEGFQVTQGSTPVHTPRNRRGPRGSQQHLHSS